MAEGISLARSAAEADVIVGVGTRLADFTTGSWALFKNPERRLIGVNVQPFDATKHHAIPVVGDFANHLRIPSILMGFGLPDDGLHSPNEKYRLENYYKGIMTIAHFFEEFGR